MVEMRVLGLSIDSQSKNPIVILREINGEGMLPIWVGAMEAMAISLVLNNEQLPRPLTHDLLLMSFKALKAQLKKVEITALKDGVYYALLILRGPEGMVRVDCRPSDAIALALRAGAAIFVEDAVLRATHPRSGTTDSPQTEEAPQQPTDAATDMMRTAGARKEMDMMNGFLSRHGSLPDADGNEDEKRLRELLRSLEPVSRRKM